jgi:hypothetical protein
VSGINADELMADAKRIVKACAIAQVGDHHSMAEAEVADQMAGILDELDLCYAIVKVFSGALAKMASEIAVELVESPAPEELEAVAIEYIRRTVDDIEYRAQSRPDDDD